MRQNMIKFGTGGWRAIIADGFTKENIRLLVGGLCRMMDKEGLAGSEICIGYDSRFLSKESAHWAAEVLAGSGYRVFMINRSSPTPLMMYTVKQRELPYGMAITASHNPAIYNGIKLFTRGGRDADQSITNRVEAEIEKLTPEDVQSLDYDTAVSEGIITEQNNTNDYIDSIISMIDVDAIKKAQLKIAMDPMYGVSQTSLKTVLITCRCDVELIHDRHDTLFGGKLPAPNQTTLQQLSNRVIERRCNIGVATDGDADRLGVIDEKGNFVHPNELLVLLYYYLVKYRGWKGDCVRNNSTTHLLDRVAAGFGQTCWEVPVGFKHVSSKMLETDAIIGGESSGGMAVKGHIFGKDGIYSAALLVEMLAITGKSVSALYDEICSLFGSLEYAESDFKMTPERKLTLKSFIFDSKKLPDFGKAILRTSYEDGCKVYFEDGSWVICRFSGTEPLLRMAAEAESSADALEYISKWKSLLEL